MAVTFKDVATLAGVSTQTVSRVTNGADNVTDSTREKVNKAIKELGYIPNKSAQMLSRGKSKTLGIVSLDIALHGVALIVNGVRQQAHDNGYGTVLSIVDSDNFERIKDEIRELLSQQVDYIVVNVPLTQFMAEELVHQFQQLNFMFIDVPENTKVNYVCAEHTEGAKSAVRHLLACKRSQFVLITGPKESTGSTLRYAGWVDELSKSQKEVVATCEGDWDAQSGYLSIREQIAKKREFDAVLVANDQMALGVLCALNEFGIRVPEQVSVVGFDNINDSAFFTPPLSTIGQSFVELGQQAVKLLLEPQETVEGEGYRQLILPTQLIVRSSTSLKIELGDHKQEILDYLDKARQLLR
ncbi:LacI family DNA-binding transcriptional regulator [Marinomonas sp. TI.3.20]|uniref:LacI family DNA-binding transcriptional regulator n=1 Tax=Marinomonas sp. TI.3.20 TaxID=3121296 RepID=UPI00311DF17B